MSSTRIVPGWMWLTGKNVQEREKKVARDALHEHVDAERLLLVSAVRETIEFDEQQGQVRLYYYAKAVRK